MIQEIDQNLIDWTTSTVGDVSVALNLPASDAEATEGISLYLFDLTHQPAASSTPPLPLEISLSYLVTAWAKTVTEEHQQISALMFAALENPQFQIQSKPVPIALWQTLPIAPRPAFVLTVSAKQARPYRAAPLVREAPILHTSPTTTLRGTVVGPEAVPIAGVGVSLPLLKRDTRTDRAGEFSFERVPTQPAVKQLQLQAKGRSYAISLEADLEAAEGGEPLVIHLNDL